MLNPLMKLASFGGICMLAVTAVAQSETRIRDPFAAVPNAFTQEYVQKLELKNVGAPDKSTGWTKQSTISAAVLPAVTARPPRAAEPTAGQVVVHDDVQWANHVDPHLFPKYGENAGHAPLGTAGLFTFSSARYKRSYLGGSDFDSIPDHDCSCPCDEWQNFCECDNCRTNWGAKFWRPSWHAPWFKHGAKHGCWRGDCK